MFEASRSSSFRGPCLRSEAQDCGCHRRIRLQLRFLAEHADRAAELEWTTEDLFGVHPQVGAVRVDACGALMVSAGKPVVAVDRDWISFGVSRYYRPAVPTPSVPVWDWREPKKR